MLSWNEPCIVIAHLVCNAATDLASPAAHQLPARREVRDPMAGVGTAGVSGGSPKGCPQCGMVCCSQNAAEVASYRERPRELPSQSSPCSGSK